MKAPDKIYIPMTPDCDVAVNDWSGVPLSQYDGKPVTENICYIHKDALLEWLKEGIRQEKKCHTEYGDACAIAYQSVIDKLNTL